MAPCDAKEKRVADESDKARIIARLSKEIDERNNRSAAEWRMFVWRATVRTTFVVKRIFDILVSLTALAMLSPFLLLIAVLIKLDSPGPVIYRQLRVGLHGRQFMFYKFRSMRDGADREKTQLLSENQSNDGVIFKMKRDPRVTRVGVFLRKTSLDELPQFFNVLLGDMSVVGPRPPLPSEVAQYTLEQRKRLDVLPGITGLWQVSGRSDIGFKQQVELDKRYIASQSLWQDIVILLKTVPAVFTGRGAY